MRYFLLLFIPFLGFSQNLPAVDFQSVDAKISINPTLRQVAGDVCYKFIVNQLVDTIRIDAVKMDFQSITINNKVVHYKVTSKQILLFEGFTTGKNTLSLSYNASPKQTMYFVGSETTNNLQIWTQGQGKYTSNWFPSFDDMNEKVVFNISVTFDKKYEVISNGVLKNSTTKGNLKTWNYTMKKPMSSYLLMVAIGKYNFTSQKSKSGVPLVYYYQPEDQEKWETTYHYSKSIFDFLENEIGYNYPWKIYKQVPVQEFLYAGMENTTATVFAQDYVVDAIGFNDKDYINVNAHELAHQWFGDLITAKSGKDHWLQEGFATYYALLAEQSVFGDDYFNWKMYEMAERLQQVVITDTIPILNEKASSLSFYQKGAWALHVLREGVGHENFRKAIVNYLKKYQFQNVVTDDFLIEINNVSNYDTASFRKKWLEQSGFDVQEALGLLKTNTFMQQYFEVAEQANVPLSEKETSFENLLTSKAFYPIKEEIIYQLQKIPFEEKESLLRTGMQTQDIHVRQAIAQNLKEIPENFKSEYETFLDDKSYITREIALNVLWSKFPADRSALLNKTKDWIGFNDKNLRILWLTLALKTTDYEKEIKVNFYKELLDYASPKFDSAIRQNALTNLIYLDRNDENYLPFLVQCLTNHKWQINKFAKERIRNLLKNKNHRTYFETLLPTLPESEQVLLNKLLKE
jgi:aminopeptidase N